MTNFSQKYLDYLVSPAWAAKREAYWVKYGRHCQVCGATDDLEVDHLDYSRLGHERLTDLLGLCRDHHQQVTAARAEAGVKSGTGYRLVTKQLFEIQLPSANRKKPKKAKYKRPKVTEKAMNEFRRRKSLSASDGFVPRHLRPGWDTESARENQGLPIVRR